MPLWGKEVLFGPRLPVKTEVLSQRSTGIAR